MKRKLKDIMVLAVCLPLFPQHVKDKGSSRLIFARYILNFVIPFAKLKLVVPLEFPSKGF